MTESTQMKVPTIPIGKIYQEYKTYINEMEKIGLREVDAHPVEVYIIGTKSNVPNRHKEEFYFDLSEAREKCRDLVCSYGKDAARVFKVSIKQN